MTTPEGSQQSTTESQSRRARQKSTASSSSSLEAPASHAYNRMELRLLHAWMSRGLTSSSLAANSEWRKIWLVEMPRLALEHDNLLYALLALSATQLTGATPADQELSVARFKYWSMALSEQQRTISSNASVDVEALTFAALLISVTAFAMIRDRDIEPYVAPVEWFEVSKGASHVCPPQADLGDESSLLRGIVDMTAPIWKDKDLAENPIDREYEPLLCQFSVWDAASDMEAYEKTLALITSFREAVLAHEPANHQVRRICIFAQLVPWEFVGFLREQRPRALIILACFFAIAGHSGALHYFGDNEGIIPKREVQAIARAVPGEWRGLMIRPVDETMAAASGLR
jgi:hypothetical protein